MESLESATYLRMAAPQDEVTNITRPQVCSVSSFLIVSANFQLSIHRISHETGWTPIQLSNFFRENQDDFIVELYVIKTYLVLA